MKIDKLTWVTGIGGLALLGLGIGMGIKQRRALGGLGRGKLKEPPMIGAYSDGNMRTTLHDSPTMPIEARVAQIQKLIHASIQDPEMRRLALSITRGCPERDKMCEARAVYHYVKQNVRYTGDVGAIQHPDGIVEGVDLYQSARRTLIDMRGGDCDDQSIAVSTLLALNGIDPTLRIVKSWGAEDWEHIFPGFFVGRKFIALDTTLPGDQSFGVEPRYFRKVDFPA